MGLRHGRAQIMGGPPWPVRIEGTWAWTGLGHVWAPGLLGLMGRRQGWALRMDGPQPHEPKGLNRPYGPSGWIASGQGWVFSMDGPYGQSGWMIGMDGACAWMGPQGLSE